MDARTTGRGDASLNTSVAVIGGGAASVALVWYLVDALVRGGNQEEHISVTILEKSQVPGVGLAYQKDAPSLLLNVAARYMSLFEEDPHDFWRWFSASRHAASHLHYTPDSYIPRWIFGEYLQSRLAEAIERGRRNGINVRVVREEVVEIRRGKRSINLHTSGGVTVESRYGVLCVGNGEPEDKYSLTGHPRYIHSPYPFFVTCAPIPKSASVGIIGTQLTAVDICLALYDAGHSGRVTLLSRSAELPSVRTPRQLHKLRHLTSDALRQKAAAATDKKLSIRDVLRLTRKELTGLNRDWRHLFFRWCAPEGIAYFEQQIAEACVPQEWQWFAVASDQIVEEAWHLLSDSAKQEFIRRYHRIWNSRRAPMPVENARRVHSLLVKSGLAIKSGLAKLESGPCGGFTATYRRIADTENHAVDSFDWVINCTGPARHIGTGGSSSLLENLVACGFANKNPHGGIDVDFASSAVIGRDGEINGRLFALGHLSIGVLYYTSSLEMISRRAKTVAHRISNAVLQTSRSLINAAG